MGKVCTKCSIEKPTAEFSKMKSSKDGFQYVCKECNLKYIAENLASRKEYLTKYYLANKNIVTIKGKQYRDLHRQEIKERDKKYRDTNKEIINENSKKYYLKNKDIYSKKGAEYYQQHKDQVAQYNAKYRQDNKEKLKDYTRNNRGKVNAKVNRRRSRKLMATPIYTNDFFIEEIYDLASRRTNTFNIPFVVDHIIPLQGKNVSGFNIETNLQILSVGDNCKKSNKFSPEEYSETQKKFHHIYLV